MEDNSCIVCPRPVLPTACLCFVRLYCCPQLHRRARASPGFSNTLQALAFKELMPTPKIAGHLNACVTLTASRSAPAPPERLLLACVTLLLPDQFQLSRSSDLFAAPRASPDFSSLPQTAASKALTPNTQIERLPPACVTPLASASRRTLAILKRALEISSRTASR